MCVQDVSGAVQRVAPDQVSLPSALGVPGERCAAWIRISTWFFDGWLAERLWLLGISAFQTSVFMWRLDNWAAEGLLADEDIHSAIHWLAGETRVMLMVLVAEDRSRAEELGSRQCRCDRRGCPDGNKRAAGVEHGLPESA